MRLRTSQWIRTGAAIAAVMLAAVAVAQERPRAAEPAQGQAPRRVTANRPTDEAASPNDQTIAECLALGNQEEIALANLAAQHSQNPQVKQFAEMLAKDHRQFLQQLQQFGGQRVAFSLEPGANNAADEANRTNREPAERAENRREAREEAADARRENPPADRTAGQGKVTQHRTGLTANGELDFLAVKQQMAQNCVQHAQRAWSEKQGQDADMCYVGGQVVMHGQMLSAQEVLRQYASPELQRVIDEGISTTRSHMAHAEKLAKELAAHKPAAGEERRTN
ncbi:MAG: DUF4142 domain-containing protein [Pirellulales bacterium]